MITRKPLKMNDLAPVRPELTPNEPALNLLRTLDEVQAELNSKPLRLGISRKIVNLTGTIIEIVNENLGLTGNEVVKTIYNHCRINEFKRPERDVIHALLRKAALEGKITRVKGNEYVYYPIYKENENG